MPSAINPNLMPQRRAQNLPPKLVSNVQMPQRTRTFDGLTSTIADMNLEVAWRLACDNATDRIETYGAMAPEGKTSRRWKPETVANVAAHLEFWFELTAERPKGNVPPGALMVARRIFVETCLDHTVRGLSVLQEDWYLKLTQKVKEERTEAKVERAAYVIVRPQRPTTIKAAERTETANDAFCAQVAAKAAQNQLIADLQGNAATLAEKMLALYPSLTGGAKARRKAAYEEALTQLNWRNRHTQTSIQNGYATFRTAINAAIAELKR